MVALAAVAVLAEALRRFAEAYVTLVLPWWVWAS